MEGALPAASPMEQPILNDRSLLPVPPDDPVGVFGFSRYYYHDVDGEIVPLLLEGPSGKQVRCQDDELPCSYLELKELYESGAEIPKELELSREELATLVQQLDTLSATLARFKSLHDACAAGYRPNTGQAHNMGIHMGLSGHHGAKKSDEFDPARPNTLLFAKKGGELLTRDEQGHCNGDRWVGTRRLSDRRRGVQGSPDPRASRGLRRPVRQLARPLQRLRQPAAPKRREPAGLEDPMRRPTAAPSWMRPATG